MAAPHGRLTKCIEKKLDGSYTRMLRTVLNKLWKQQFYKTATVQPLASDLTDHSSKTDKTCDTLDARTNSFATLSYGHLHMDVSMLAEQQSIQFNADTRYNQEDLLGAMDNWDEWRVRVRKLNAISSTWWLLHVCVKWRGRCLFPS